MGHIAPSDIEALPLGKGVDDIGLIGVLTEADPVDFKPTAVVLSGVGSNFSSVLFVVLEDSEGGVWRLDNKGVVFSLGQDDEALTGIAGVGGDAEAVVVSWDSEGEVGVKGRYNFIVGVTLGDKMVRDLGGSLHLTIISYIKSINFGEFIS